MIRAFTIKRDKLRKMSDEDREKLIENGELTEEQLDNFIDDAYDVEEIADEIEASKNLKSAYKKLGLSMSEVKTAKIKKKKKSKV